MAARSMRGVLIAAAISLWAFPSLARDEAGRLDIVISPNNTRPAMVTPGSWFEVTLRDRAQLTLHSVSGQFSVAVNWSPNTGGPWRGRCRVAANLPPGVYSLRATTASEVDENHRALFVYGSFPDEYRVAHLTNLRLGSKEGRDMRIYQSIKAINASGASLVLVGGELTAGGTPEQLALVVDMMNGCIAPTFVCPGAGDIDAGNAESYFGSVPMAFRFGPDGYLGHHLSGRDSSGFSGTAGRAYTLRRELRSARWSVGFSDRFGGELAVRDQLVLFVDDPLDYLMTAKGPRGTEVGAPISIEWGSTRGLPVPAADQGAVQLFAVGRGGVQIIEMPEEE